MVKLEPIRTAVRSRSSSSSSDGDDARSTSSSDSCLSLVETSATSKSCSSTNNIHKRKIPSSTQTLIQGTLIRDVNNNLWMLHQCVKVSRHFDRFMYVCSQVKRPPTATNKTLPIEQNIVKTKISPLMYLTDKLKQSRQAVIDKARAENDKLDYVFYGAVLGDANREEELILPHPTANINLYQINLRMEQKMIHGIVEFLPDDETYESKTKINKYSIEMIFIQDNTNTIQNPSELLQQVLKKEIDKLKESRRQHSINNDGSNSHKFIITKKPGNEIQYDIQETFVDEENPTLDSNTTTTTTTNKYLLKIELVTSSSSKHYTIDHEIAFYSRFATHEKLKAYVKRHALMYLAIPEYITHGTHKHGTLTYKFLVMEQYRENLRSLIYSYDQSLPEHNALNLFLQMLFVMQFLHEKNFVHKIIKPKYLMFANKQPYFIFLTQFRTVKNINDHTIDSNEVPNENRPISIEPHLKQQNHQVKKKVKRSHRTQLAAIHNKTSSVVPSPLSVVDIPSPIIEEDNLLTNSLHYYHPYSVYSSLDMHLHAKQTYRGDLEMLGYNLIVWSGGRLPWDNKTHINTKLQRETITNEKKLAKSNVNEFVKKCFFMKLISPVTLRAICDYMSTIYQLNIDDMPNFDQLRAPIKEIVKALGFKANACLRLSNSKSKTANNTANGTGANASVNAATTNSSIKNNIEIPSPAKELEVEQDDIEDDDDDEEDEDEDDDEDDEDDEDEEDEDDEDETHPCPPGSSSCEDESSDDDDDNRMEQQIPSISGQSSSINNKCKRCGGDHSLEDQQSQSSSDKQSSNGIIAGTNGLTYQQKRQRSIAKRLQLRRKKKN